MQVWTAHVHVKRNLFAAVAQQRNAEVQMADDECGNALACLQVRHPFWFCSLLLAWACCSCWVLLNDHVLTALVSMGNITATWVSVLHAVPTSLPLSLLQLLAA